VNLFASYDGVLFTLYIRKFLLPLTSRCY